MFGISYVAGAQPCAVSAQKEAIIRVSEELALAELLFRHPPCFLYPTGTVLTPLGSTEWWNHNLLPMSFTEEPQLFNMTKQITGKAASQLYWA